MHDICFKDFFQKSPTAYVYYQVVRDDQGQPYDYEVLEVNHAYEKIMNAQVTQMIGKRFSELYPTGWKQDKKWKEALLVAVKQQIITHFDLYHHTLKKWLRIIIFPIYTDYFSWILHDVSNEYRLDKEVDDFLKANLEMLCVIDEKGQFIKVNHEFENTLGYKVEDLVGKNLSSFIHKEDLSFTLAIKEKEVQNFVNRFYCKDGSNKYLEWRAQAYGQYIYASARDVTEKIMLTQELYQHNQELMKLTETLQKKNEALHTLAITDELTGLYNRHFLEYRINEEMQRSDSTNEPLSIVILDLDYFKKINDKWGHPVGDEVLKLTGEITRHVIRKSDLLVRIGGEEFVVVLPNTNLNGALIVAEKIRKALCKNCHPLTGTLTASFGVAERRKSESYYHWYKRADEALYRAKESGRNCVISSDDQSGLPVAFIRLEWNNEWESGNEEIDKQHKELIELANTLIYMSLSNVGVDKTMCQLDKVLHHIVEHFAAEEKIIKDAGYPYYEKHAQIHKSLVKKALQLKENYLNGKLKSSAFFSFIVDDIIVGHMLHSDMDFFSYTHK